MARYPKSSTPKLTEELIDKLAVVIRHGAYIETAAAFCGVHKDSLYHWLKMAASDEATELHHKLNDALKRAMAEAEVRDLSVINKGRPRGNLASRCLALGKKTSGAVGTASALGGPAFRYRRTTHRDHGSY